MRLHETVDIERTASGTGQLSLMQECEHDGCGQTQCGRTRVRSVPKLAPLRVHCESSFQRLKRGFEHMVDGRGAASGIGQAVYQRAREDGADAVLPPFDQGASELVHRLRERRVARVPGSRQVRGAAPLRRIETGPESAVVVTEVVPQSGHGDAGGVRQRGKTRRHPIRIEQSPRNREREFVALSRKVGVSSSTGARHGLISAIK